jgi:outer membrane lipoprotein carrier protein
MPLTMLLTAIHKACLLFAAAVAAPAPAAPLPLADVVARVQKNYDGAQSYKAKFEQSQLNATFGRTTKSSGDVTFKKPGRMRWDYALPEKKMFVSSGDVLWLFEPEDKQAFRQELKQSQLPAALAFLMGKGRLADQFNIELAPKLEYGRPGDYRLSLKPKQPQSTYKAIYFVVDPASFQVRETVLVDSQGNVNDVTFKDMVFNLKVADTLFQWKPPAGVRVIDAAKARP